MPTFPSDLTVRRAREGDLPEMARVHYAAYPGSKMTLEERIERFRSNPRLPMEDHWVCLRGGKLVGLFALYNFRMFWQGVLIPTGGIGNVAVAPEARRERVAYWMMARSVEIMKQNGVPLSILYPFRHSFYRHLGWGLVGQTRLYRFAPEILPAYPERSGVNPVVTYEDREEVMACYRRFAEAHNGLLERSEPVWFERVLKNAQCYGYRAPDSGQMEGYLAFQYHPHPVEERFLSSDLEVRDFIWNSQRALYGLLGFLSAQRDQVKIVVFPDQSQLPFEHIMGDPQMPDGRHGWMMGSEMAWVGAGLMGRIVQLRKVLGAGSYGPGEGVVTFQVADDLNPDNARPLTVEFSRGKAQFPQRQEARISLSTDIATFSSIYWGALPLPDAVLLGMVRIEGEDDASFLNDLFTASKPLCLDFF